MRGAKKRLVFDSLQLERGEGSSMTLDQLARQPAHRVVADIGSAGLVAM